MKPDSQNVSIELIAAAPVAIERLGPFAAKIKRAPGPAARKHVQRLT
jgi:hypothetical protein